MTDQEYKDIMRRLRFQCSPGAEEIMRAGLVFYDWGAGLMFLSFILGIAICTSNEKDDSIYLVGVGAMAFAASLFFIIPILSDWWRKKVSREVHRKYRCQCEWHQEKFGKN